MTTTEANNPKLRRRRKVAYALGGLVVLSVATIFLLPFAVREGIEYVLREQGEENPNIEEIYLNPFSGVLQVKGLTGGDREEDLLRAGNVRFELDWSELFQRNIFVKTVIVEDVTLHVRQLVDGRWQLGRMTFDPATGDVEGDLTFGVGTDAVTMRNISVLFERPDLTLDVTLNEATLGELRSWEASDQAPFDIDMTVNGGKVRVSGTTSPFGGVAQASASLDMTSIPLDAFAAIAQASGVYGLGGTANANLDAEFQFDFDAETVSASAKGTSSLIQLAAAYETYSATFKSLSWDGALGIEGALATPSLNAEGRLTLANLSVSDDPDSLTSDIESADWNGTARASLTDPLEAHVTGTIGITSIIATLTDLPVRTARVSSVEGSADSIQLVLSENASVDLSTLNVVLNDIEAEGVLAESGAVRVARADMAADTITLTMDDAGLAVRGGVRATLRDMEAREVHPELAEARLGSGSVGLEDLQLDMLEDGWSIVATTQVLGEDGSSRLISSPIASAIKTTRANATAGVEWIDGTLTAISVAGNAYADGVEVNNTSTGLLVARFEHGELTDVTVEAIDRARAERASLRFATLLERPGTEGAYVAKIESVNAEEAVFTGDLLSFGRVILSGLFGHAVITEEREIEPLELLVTTFTDEELVREIERQVNQFGSSYGVVEIKGGSELILEDRSVTPAAKLTLTDLTARMEQFNTLEADEMVPVSVQARVGDNTQLSLEGKAAIISAPPDLDLQAQVQALHLPEFTGHSRRYVGYGVESGRFSTQSRIELDSGQLDTNHSIRVQDLQLDRLKEDELSELDQQIGMPLNAAVNLLRDSDGNITLELPITGDLESPELDLSQAIRQAVGNAMKKGVLAVFTPLRLLGKIGGGDKPLDEALQLEEVVFEANSAELTEQATDYLDEMAGIMRKHPGISLNVQGIAAYEDIEALRAAALSESPLSGETSPSENRSFGPVLVPQGEAENFAPRPESDEPPQAPGAPLEVADENLLALADARAAAVSEYLQTSGDINAARVFVSQSAIEREAGGEGPRVHLSL